MRKLLTLAGLLLCSAMLIADEHSIDFDRHTDFSKLKTFALREGKVTSPTPELDNPLLVRKVGDAIRAGLAARGLKETASGPDIMVDYSVTGEDFSEQRGGPAAFSQGTLVIDLMRRDSNALVWRGVYRDNERNNARLAQKLPEDAKKTLAEYPPRQKGVIEPAPPAPIVKQILSPRTAAVAALEIINSTRQDTAYVGPVAHPGLAVRFNQLERTSRALTEELPENRSIAANRANEFVKAIEETAAFATSIAERPGETPADRAKSRDLAAKLLALVAH